MDEGSGTEEVESGTDEVGAAKSRGNGKRAKAVERPYPRRTIEAALTVPRALKEQNGGNPWEPTEVARAVGLGNSDPFYYLTAASRDYGFTEGTRNAASISLTELGRSAVYAASPEGEQEALRKAFFSVDVFRRVVEYYKGSKLPESRFLSNALESTFGLDPRAHDEFVKIFEADCRFLGIGHDWDPAATREATTTGSNRTSSQTRTGASPSAAARTCFVIMPFLERTDSYATGFFDEVLEALYRPAATAAGFEVKTAKRTGSDLIHSTIVTELLRADLVLADLTEHNPNVLFELGVRMALDLPVALVRAKGTGAIFDVDNLLRVEDYNPNLWPTTVEKDVPRLTDHIRVTWENRDTSVTFMKLLGQRP